MGDLISIILPVYNGERFLKASIESCLAQTYSNFELIIVDDCSTDSTNEIAREYVERDDRVKLIVNTKNMRLPASLNVGHNAARGIFITWTSDDNLYQKDALFNLHKTLKAVPAEIVYANYLQINLDGDLTGSTNLKPIEYLIYDNTIGPCFLYERRVFDKCGGYNPNHFLIEDFEFWLKAASHFKFYKIENPGFYFYRLHEKSLSSKMVVNLNLKDQFHQNKINLFRNILEELNLYNTDLVLNYFINRYKKNRFSKEFPFTQKNFIKDIEAVSNHFKAFYKGKLKRIVIEDAVDNIMNSKSWQNFSVLLKLHKEAGFNLLNLTIRRYLSLLKKCIFN
jgi:glycosyltransferase involved in cell wall biosynthesis